ncbi:MAG: hypothetical protein HYR71_14320, partial [Chloroflexi bacterium]|nr:hypothetical protein [Chloroflexota bacterium]
TLDDERQRTYVARFPPARERPRFDHFAGLSPEVNLSLGEYRLYKFFRPWPSPRLLMVWNHHNPQRLMLGVNDLQVQLQPLGQAQAWVGPHAAVLWECYLQAQGREGRWRERLAALWRAVEGDLRGRTLYTPSYEPTIEQGYTEFLSERGYVEIGGNARWWCKALPARDRSEE